MSTYFPNIDIFHLIHRGLNTLNYRLLDHAERVAYITIALLQYENKYSKEEILEIAYITLLHDIGAFKTDAIAFLADVEQALNFELANTVSHSVYSYLFLKYFTKLSDKTEAVIYHHTIYSKLEQMETKYPDISAKIFLADRIDMLLRTGKIEVADQIWKILSSSVFCQSDVEMLKKLEEEQEIITKCITGSFMTEIVDYFESNTFSNDVVTSLVEMLCFTIDFRSTATLTHTLATVEISLQLAKLYNFSEEEIIKVYFGALLHDIGKISTSLMVLEKDDKLTNVEYHYIKDHVVFSENILRGNIDEEIVEIAIRHHEKLNGNGYPNGILADNLTLPQRIVCIADIASALTGKRSYKNPFPQEKVIAIMRDMVEKGELCRTIVEDFISNYDEILEIVDVKSVDISNKYEELSKEYNHLLEINII